MRIPSFRVALACLALPLASLAAQDEGATGHGRLGIFLEDRSDRSDSVGARVRGVVPEGPAAKAGLERGDVILRFNGTALAGAPKLIELAHRLEPGDTVKLEYRRDGQTRTATVIADRVGPRFTMMFHRMPGGEFGFHAGPDMLFFHTHGQAGLALVQMSRDLGEYFGTSEGLLVVRPPADSASPLKAGDVILAIDGRKPQSVEHALRILGSYAPGEKAKLDVMRKRQRTTLGWTAPERPHDQNQRFERRHGMGPGDPVESWGAMMDSWAPMMDSLGGMDFEIPVPAPGMDFMLQPPTALDAQET
jgi:S1-C subfamily serine protease